jgi:type I restriction-modification system DNA methylase subunit
MRRKAQCRAVSSSCNIAFAEDTFLLPENSLQTAIAFNNPYDPKPKWEQVKRLFHWVDKGASEQNIPPYNGGLFVTEAELDAVPVPDELVGRFALLSKYDFRSEVSVTILGHIFEQSITDIEELRAGAAPDAASKAGKRKREGVVYTPNFVTRFIVEQTIGRRLAEIADALLPDYGVLGADGEIDWRKAGRRRTAETDYWRAYLDRIAGLRIVDPACGSGAFLVAAFDFLHDEQKRVRTRLGELEAGLLVHAEEQADVEIITNNLFGVDVNPESVELTKLALWLKTAKRNRPLKSLDANILHGNSLVANPAYDPHSFDWRTRFAQIFEQNGFDIVLGNPPYVRMEFLKAIKPYLGSRYSVASDRADLYAYFFELALEILKPGGRMGYISSSTFFRTGSGEKLRHHLATRANVETVIDFGELQLFEGVTTYPAILTAQKTQSERDETSAGDLSYLTVRTMPDDLSKTFGIEGRAMPRSRLGRGTWRFESDTLDAIRAKLAAGRPSLAQLFGKPLYGIKTGLNGAFVLSRAERDALIAQDPSSAELLKPYLIGENLKRWHSEPDDLWLIYTPKNRFDIADFPAVEEHLRPWRNRLEARATQQQWWELQQAQANYQPHFTSPKLIWPHFQNRASFSIEAQPHYLNNKCFFWPGEQPGLCSLLNSKVSWFMLTSIARTKRGGFLEAEAQYVGVLPSLEPSQLASLDDAAKRATAAAAELHELRHRGRARLGDLNPAIRDKTVFLDWPGMTFSELQAQLKKQYKMIIPVAERDEWEHWLHARRGDADRLAHCISDAEAEIDARVYQMFDLSPTEIAAIEDALALASPGLNLKAYEAVSAVEGLALTEEARGRIAGPASSADRRTEIERAYNS